ncbi:MAG: hypothetical protein ABFD54_11520 [Armatimonadota bacterium]|nr:YjbH domain-containing protein [bacterium]
MHYSRLMIALIAALAIAAPACAAPDVPCPQYINIAPLPGGGTAIDSQGKPDGLGAVQINIPLAYTPGWSYLGMSAYKGSHDGTVETDNGSGVLALGFGGWPRIYASAMQVSSIWPEAKAVNGQVALSEEKAHTPALAFGVQDILNKEHATTGRSYYWSATKSVQLDGHNAYATLGFGTGRFLKRVFTGISMPYGDRTNLISEWDGYQINAGVTYRPSGRYGNTTLLAAHNGKVGWLFGLSNTFDIAR